MEKKKKKENYLKRLSLRFYDNNMNVYNKLKQIQDDTGLPFNEIILDMINKGQVKIDKSLEEYNELLRINLYQLSKMGNNLNQLMKLIYSGKCVSSDVIEKLLAEISLNLISLKDLMVNKMVNKNDK